MNRPKNSSLDAAPSAAPLGCLDLADQIQRRGQSGFAFFPLSWANFAWMRSGVLSSLQLAQGLGNVASDFVGVNLNGLDHAFRVDQESTAQGKTFFSNVNAESVGQLVRPCERSGYRW